MEFTIGQMLIKTIEGDRITVVVPIGPVMFAINVELFVINKHKSIKVMAEVYERDDEFVVNRVNKWMEGG